MFLKLAIFFINWVHLYSSSCFAVKSTKSQQEDGKKKKKEFINLAYEVEEDPDVEKLFAVTRKATKLSQTTFKLWSKDKTTLPVDLHYDGRNFTK